MDFLIEQVSRHDPECTKVEIPQVLYNAVTGDELISFVEALKQNPHVRKIDFYHARRTPELFRRLASLFRMNTAIQHVRFPVGTSNKDLVPIEGSLRDNTSMRALDLYHCCIQGGEVVGSLLLSNGTITEINLSFNYSFGAEGAASVAKALRNDRCTLKKLELQVCGIGDNGARELSNALGNNSLLGELRIRTNRITLIGFRYVMKMLVTNSSLEIVDLEQNPLDEGRTRNETAGDHVSQALRCNTSLRELNLNLCGLSAADVSSVFQTLAGDNQTLSVLRIAGNEMDEASTNSLGRLVGETNVLEMIEFSWYKGVSATVLRRLLESLQNNKSLVCIETPENSGLQGMGSRILWCTWSRFVSGRNRMRPLLEGNAEAYGSRRGACPQSLWPYLLKWCNKNRETATVSLINHVLCARSNEIFCGLVTTTTGKRPALEA